MALIKCPECKNNMSSSANKCPNCGKITETGKKKNKKLLGVFIAFLLLIVVLFTIDRTGILKTCDDDSEKRGNVCISEHISDAQYEDTCMEGLYVKDGRCYHKLTGAKLGLPTRKYYCSNGYLRKTIRGGVCVVETTYDAYYNFNE